jgi:hypothetical protein
MQSTQIHQVLQHIFQVGFDGQINVSLNIGLIKYLQELVHQFEDQYRRALQGPSVPMESTSTSTIGEKPGEDSKDEVEVEEDAAQKEELSLEKGEPEPSSGAAAAAATATATATAVNNELEYQALIPVNFQPQLQIMGEATPPVEWLGLKRDRIPAIIHEEVTLNLEKVLLLGWKLYEEQLEDMTFEQ